MDKEYEQTVAALPKPAEALQRLKDQKQKQREVKKPNQSEADTDDLVKEMAEQGFVVKVGKKKSQRPKY